MEKVLELYKYIDGVNDTKFPSNEEQLIVGEFRYDAKRMGGAPTISFTAMHRLCLDDLWSKDVYATFNGERYYIRQTPTSSYSNADARYKHEVELVSERMILDNIYFYDVVQENSNVDKPVSNSSKFAFFGDVEEYVARLNASLSWSNVDYNVVIDEGIVSEEKQVSFENQVITTALQEIYNIYQIPYYFVGKTIHVGTYQESIDHLFKYGVENSLLSISKDNANAKIINRITGVGSADNIPYYYPNDDGKGVTRPLLNGSTSGVEIVDSSKYRKVRLSDTFNFSSSLQTSTPLLDVSKYTLGDLRYDFFNDDKAQYSLDFYYSFTLNQGENVEFVVETTYQDSVELRYEIYKTSGRHLGYFSGMNNLSLTGGTYNLIIRWKFLYEDSLIALEEYLPTLLEEYLQVGAYVVVDAQNQWTLNSIPVSLSNYGLSVSTPTDGDVISIQQTSYINTQSFLMPPIYRSTWGDERFYNAENNTYKDKNGVYYTFDNEYSSLNPREHIENFDDIRPTIKNVTNSTGNYIDRFVDFAYDLHDNDDVDEEGKYVHKYFFAKLNKFDGDNGFNLFDHAIDESEMVISMTSGSCGSCSFKIMVNKETQKNTVQVDEYGNLLRDSSGNVRFGSPQEKQNDTINNQVWIALEKDAQTFGVLMPNASKEYRPIAGDTFVILHIDLPKAYIIAAEKRLEEELIKYMFENNFEKFNFSISFSRIFFAEHPEILQKVSENSKLQVEYNGTTYDLFVSSLSYSMTSDHPLPEIKVELDDAITISQNQISQIVESTKKEIISSTKKDVFWGDIKGIPSWITSEKPKYSYSELSGATNATDGLWVVKSDVTGEPYIYTTFNVVTEKGITMYANNTTLDLPSIYAGLPVDNSSIYWEDVTDEEGNVIDRVLKAKADDFKGTLGSLTNVGEWADDVATDDRIMVQKKNSQDWEALSLSELKDGDHDNSNWKGYVVLKEDESPIGQLTSENTIYEIRYDYNLSGGTLTIPEGCVLKFEGGSLVGGTIVGNNTCIQADAVQIFSTNTTLEGNWDVLEGFPEWFGAKGDGVTDDAPYIQKCMDSFDVTRLHNKTYLLDSIQDSDYKACLNLPTGKKFKGSLTKSTLTDDNGTLAVGSSITPSVIVYIGSKCHMSDMNIRGNAMSNSSIKQTGVKTFTGAYYKLSNVGVAGVYYGFDICAFMSTIDGCTSSYNYIGFYVRGILSSSDTLLAENTSIFMKNCYAVDCYMQGYYLRGLIYSSIVSCGADGCGWQGYTTPITSSRRVETYWIRECKGVSLEACGMEQATKAVRFSSSYECSFRNSVFILKTTDLATDYSFNNTFVFGYCRNILLENIMVKHDGVTFSSNNKLFYFESATTGLLYAKLVNISNVYDGNLYDLMSFVGMGTPRYDCVDVSDAQFRRRSGPTSLRPKLSSYELGTTYYDEDLKKLLYWNGSTWIDDTSRDIAPETNDMYTLGTSEKQYKNVYAKKITVDGISISKYKDGVLCIEGNLAVTGGVTMYAIGEQDIPTVMDGIKVDGTTISKENGYLEVIGNTGSTIDESKFPKLNGLMGSGADLNNATRAGYYKVGLCDNMPSDGMYQYGMLETIEVYTANSDNESRIAQVYYPHAVGPGYTEAALAVRLRNGGTWTDWRIVPTSKGNIASADTADALTNSVSIWGQSFDGRYGISGNIDDAGNVTPMYDGSYSLGSSSYTWANVWTSAVNLPATGNAFTLAGIKFGNKGRIGVNSSGQVGIYGIGSSSGIFLRPNCTTAGVSSVGAVIDASGNLSITGTLSQSSDERKKTILNHVKLSLEDIAKAPLVEHYYNCDENKAIHVGSIAQYWADMNDWFCKKDDEGYYIMEVPNCALASAISVARELLKFESDTDSRIDLLEKEIKELKEEIEQLKTT